MKARLRALLASVRIDTRRRFAPAAGGAECARPLAPADSASVTLPFTISWSAASDPSGTAVSASSAFAKALVRQDLGAPRPPDQRCRQRPRGRDVLLARPGREQRLRPGPVVDPARRVKGSRAPVWGFPTSPTLNPPARRHQLRSPESFGMSWSGVAGVTRRPRGVAPVGSRPTASSSAGRVRLPRRRS